jgi:hypothetical protein
VAPAGRGAEAAQPTAPAERGAAAARSAAPAAHDAATAARPGDLPGLQQHAGHPAGTIERDSRISSCQEVMAASDWLPVG